MSADERIAIQWQIDAARAYRFSLSGTAFDRAAWQRTSAWMYEHARDARERWMRD